MQAEHDKIKKYFEDNTNVHEVKEVIELPNKYDDNVSHFGIVYNYEDQFNHTCQDFNVHWDTKILFVRCEGYFNFNTTDELIKKVCEFLPF